MRDGPQVRVAQLARSCARFLGRAPLVSRERLSAESAAAVGECERVVADALRYTAEVLVGYAAGAPSAGEGLPSWSGTFVAESGRLQQALDEDPALGVLRDVFADVVRDATKASASPADVEPVAAATVSAPAPVVRRSRPAKPAAVPAARRPRRRPDWQPPADPAAGGVN